jgi:hypothetical protein
MILLSWACSHGYDVVVEYLLNVGDKTNRPYGSHFVPLVATFDTLDGEPNLRIMELLLIAGDDPNTKMEQHHYSITLLERIIDRDLHVDAVNLLIRHHANVNVIVGPGIMLCDLARQLWRAKLEHLLVVNGGRYFAEL